MLTGLVFVERCRTGGQGGTPRPKRLPTHSLPLLRCCLLLRHPLPLPHTYTYTEHSWRAGVGLRPYIRDAQRLLSRAQAAGSTSIPQRKIDFLHLPIIDGSVTTDSAMSRLADDCCGRVLRGETMYIHCW
jgi:hypothetical protein